MAEALIDRSGKDNWLPAIWESGGNFHIFDAQFEGFMYPGWGAPSQEDSRAFNVFSGSFQSYYLPVANIPFNAVLTKLGWSWNGQDRSTSQYSSPNFDVDITVYVYCGFHVPTEAGVGTGINAVPGRDDGSGMFLSNSFTHRWRHDVDGECGWLSLPVAQRITNNSGAYTAVSMSVRGRAPTDSLVGGLPTVLQDDFSEWRGSFACAAVFRSVPP